MNDPSRTVLPTPAESELLVRTLCAATEQEYRETWTLAEVAGLLRSCEYDVTPGQLLRLISRGYISAPPDGAWTAQSIHCAAAACEARRRWLPSPSRHDFKKSAARLQIEAAQQQGIEVFVDLGCHSLEDLLLQLTGCDQRQVREVLYESVIAKLDQLGFIEE